MAARAELAARLVEAPRETVVVVALLQQVLDDERRLDRVAFEDEGRLEAELALGLRLRDVRPRRAAAPSPRPLLLLPGRPVAAPPDRNGGTFLSPRLPWRPAVPPSGVRARWS